MPFSIYSLLPHCVGFYGVYLITPDNTKPTQYYVTGKLLMYGVEGPWIIGAFRSSWEKARFHKISE